MLLCRCGIEQILLLINHFNPKFCENIFSLLLKYARVTHKVISVFLLLFSFSLSVTAPSCFLCLFMFQFWCYSYLKRISFWLPIFFILISNDIHFNPGPYNRKDCFSFMSWNLNSIAKDNFQRADLMEAHNVSFKYDITSICEASLNDSVELPETLLNNYTLVSANNPANTRHGGVGLFYKNSLPVIVRNDLSFDESIALELNFGRKK